MQNGAVIHWYVHSNTSSYQTTEIANVCLKLIWLAHFSGLLHAPSITRAEITSVSETRFVNEIVKVLVGK